MEYRGRYGELPTGTLLRRRPGPDRAFHDGQPGSSRFSGRSTLILATGRRSRWAPTTPRMKRTSPSTRRETDVFSTAAPEHDSSGIGVGRTTSRPSRRLIPGIQPIRLTAAALSESMYTDGTSPQTGRHCNPVLDLRAFQFLPPNVDFPNAVESGTSKDDDTDLDRATLRSMSRTT